MRDTWYVLEDGGAGNPAECEVDDTGVLRHKDGAAVKMRSSDTPLSRSVDVDAEHAKAQAARDAAEAAKLEASKKAAAKQVEGQGAEKEAASDANREMTADTGGKKYKTRESKAD